MTSRQQYHVTYDRLSSSKRDRKLSLTVEDEARWFVTEAVRSSPTRADSVVWARRRRPAIEVVKEEVVNIIVE